MNTDAIVSKYNLDLNTFDDIFIFIYATIASIINFIYAVCNM